MRSRMLRVAVGAVRVSLAGGVVAATAIAGLAVVTEETPSTIVALADPVLQLEDDIKAWELTVTMSDTVASHQAGVVRAELGLVSRQESADPAPRSEPDQRQVCVELVGAAFEISSATQGDCYAALPGPGGLLTWQWGFRPHDGIAGEQPLSVELWMREAGDVRLSAGADLPPVDVDRNWLDDYPLFVFAGLTGGLALAVFILSPLFAAELRHLFGLGERTG